MAINRYLNKLLQTDKVDYVIAIGSSAGGRLQGGDGTGDDNYGIYIGRNAGINIDSNNVISTVGGLSS